MKKTGLILIAMMLVSLLVIVPAMSAVNNISLAAAGNSGITGSASAIAGSFGGVTPHAHLEVNVMMSRLPDANMVYEAWLVDSKSNMKQSIGVLDGRLLNANLTLPGFDPNGPWNAVAVSMEPVNDTNLAPATIVAQGDLPGTAVTASNFTTAAVLPPDESFQRQLTMQRFGLTGDQVTAMRMQGVRYREINLVANAAAQCNQNPLQALDTYMRNGTEPSALASMCNTTVASILTPMPMQAVAGAIQETGPMTSMPGTMGAGMPTVAPLMIYRTYPNGAPVLTESMWRSYQRRGYSWDDVAIATNIASMSNVNIDDLLRMIRIQGLTWNQIIMEQGLKPSNVYDISGWPFSRTGRSLTTPNPPSSSNAPNY